MLYGHSEFKPKVFSHRLAPLVCGISASQMVMMWRIILLANRVIGFCNGTVSKSPA